MNRSVLLTAVALLLATAPGPARASDRLDTVAAALRTDTVVVSPDMQDAFPPAIARDLRARIAALDAPFDLRVAVVPTVDADESGGDEMRILYALSDRLPTVPRVLLLIGSRRQLDILPQRVDREVPLPYELRDADGRETPAQLRSRLAGAVRSIVSGSGAGTYVEERPTGPPRPLYRGEDEDEDGGPGWRTMLLLWGLGTVAGVGAWVVRRPWRSR